eukprot:TRINITY_DN8420_c0_g1_i6.p1 TRINITY_DN8420_c0_g1~~TRINITY_DN8420_c0_g1_i6.p1  ORF type:complete len:313 (+),score=60.66 TRINITY_DN8420_c0_g1_i6:61-999(+)
MSARDLMRSMLEDLMGAEALGDGTGITSLDDDRLCHHYLVDLCPYELFANTKADMGSCGKQHNDNMKREYEKQLAEGKQFPWERELLDLYYQIIREVDLKVKRANDRLERDNKFDAAMKVKAAKVEEISEVMGKKLAEAEALGEKGKVEESLKLMAEVEALKGQRAEAEAEFKELLPPGSQQQQKLRVCEACGSFLSIFDNDRRLADHFGGKMHAGYQTIRDHIKVLEEKLGTSGPPPRSSRDDRRDSGPPRDDRGYRDDRRYDDRRRDRYDDRRGGGYGGYGRGGYDDRRDRRDRDRDYYRRDRYDDRRRY